MATGKPRVSAATLARVRDYACDEPSFTVAFMAWELGLSASSIYPCVERLLEQGTIVEIEPRSGPYAATYAYNAELPKTPRTNVRRLFGELDDARVGELAPARGKIVPHTRIEGRSGKPGEDRRRQARGVRLGRGKGAA